MDDYQNNSLNNCYHNDENGEPREPVDGSQQPELPPETQDNASDFSGELKETAEAPAEDGQQTTWQTPAEPGVYHNAGTGRKEAPYAASPYGEYCRNPQTDSWDGVCHSEPAPQPVKKRREKKSGVAGKVVAAVVAFALVGTGSGFLGAYLTDNRWEQTASDLQSQIDTLQRRSSATGANVTIGGDGASVNPVVNSDLMTPSQVYAQNVPSVVSIINKGVTSNGWAQQEFTGSGSGFILTADGYILTNYHVVENAQTLTVTTYDGTEYEARLVGSDSYSDVALLKVEATDLPAVTIGDSDALSVGDQVAAIGNPLGELTSSQTVGYVSAKNRTVDTDGTILNMLQTDAAINSGNSGGPLFNMYGQVVGITTAKYSGSSNSGASIEGIGFAIPINDVMNLVDDLMEYGYVTNRAYLGVTVREMDTSVAQAYGLPTGPRIESVTEGSCAEKAGVQVGDIVTALGDQKLSSYSNLAYALRSFRAGDTTTITVFRSGQELTLTVTLDEKPAQTDTQQGTQTPSGQMPESGSYEDWYNFFFPYGNNNP